MAVSVAPLRLCVLDGALAIHRLAPDAPIDPDWLTHAGFVSVTRTAQELSLVALETLDLEGARTEAGWRALRVDGPLDFALTGIMAALSGALAQAGVSLFALSTFDTDYILVRAEALPAAIAALREAGHEVAAHDPSGADA